MIEGDKGWRFVLLASAVLTAGACRTDGRCSDVVPLVGRIAASAQPPANNNCPRGTPAHTACEYGDAPGPEAATSAAVPGRLLQVQGSKNDHKLTVLWTGCRDAGVSVSETDQFVRIKVSQRADCAGSLTWGRNVELANPVGNRAVRDLTPGTDCD